MKYLVVYWLGVASCYAVTWFSTHPADRDALFSKVKAFFKRGE